MNVKLINASLDTVKSAEGKEELVLRGVIDYQTIKYIQSGDYQREIGSEVKIKTLVAALQKSKVPDIEIGLRGDHINCNADQVVLIGDVFVIDGLQRLSAALYWMERDPEAKPRIGCACHVDTTYEWERERFRILNQERSKLSVNVLLRNYGGLSVAVDALKKLSTDKSFVLGDKVSWQQTMRRQHLITASTLCSVVAGLHWRFGPGGYKQTTAMVKALDNQMIKAGKISFRENVKDFFGVVDKCFNIRDIAVSKAVTHLRVNFLLALSQLFTRVDSFWTGNRLRVPTEAIKKLAKFPMSDPEVARVSSGSSVGKEYLIKLLFDHLNKGRQAENRIKLTDLDFQVMPFNKNKNYEPVAVAEGEE